MKSLMFICFLPFSLASLSLSASPFAHQVLKESMSDMVDTTNIVKESEKSLMRFKNIIETGKKTSHKFLVYEGFGREDDYEIPLNAAAKEIKLLQRDGNKVVIVGYNNGTNVGIASLKGKYSALKVRRELHKRGLQNLEVLGVFSDSEESKTVDIWYLESGSATKDFALSPMP